MIARFLDCRSLKIYPVHAYSYKEDFRIAGSAVYFLWRYFNFELYELFFYIHDGSASEQTENILIT